MIFLRSNLKALAIFLLLKEAEKITLASAATGAGIPFHPGAIKYYKEQKAWPEK